MFIPQNEFVIFAYKNCEKNIFSEYFFWGVVIFLNPVHKGKNLFPDIFDEFWFLEKSSQKKYLLFKFTLEIFEEYFFWIFEFSSKPEDFRVRFVCHRLRMSFVLYIKSEQLIFLFSWRKLYFRKSFSVDFAVTNFSVKKSCKIYDRPQLIFSMGKTSDFEENSKFKKKYSSKISSVNLKKKYIVSELFSKNQISSEISGNKFFPLCTVFRNITKPRKKYSEKIFFSKCLSHKMNFSFLPINILKKIFFLNILFEAFSYS